MGKLITTHLTVNASAEDVWATLTDLAGYRTWNPFITTAAGTVGVGERLDLTIQPPGGRAMGFRPWVTAVEQHRYLEWLGRLAMPGIFDGRHSFTLTPMRAAAPSSSSQRPSPASSCHSPRRCSPAPGRGSSP